jgi:hypothetical protein
MHSANFETYLLCAVAAVFLIARQFVTQPRNARRMWLVPAAGAIFGLQALSKTPPDNAAAAAFIMFSLALAAGLGLARGFTLRAWAGAGGQILTCGSRATLGLWAVAVVVRVGLYLIAPHGAPVSDLPLFLGATFGAQNVVVWLRAQNAMQAAGETRTSRTCVLNSG